MGWIGTDGRCVCGGRGVKGGGGGAMHTTSLNKGITVVEALKMDLFFEFVL